MFSIKPTINTDVHGRTVYSISMQQASYFALMLMVPIIICFGLPYYLLWSENVLLALRFKSFLYLIAFIVFGAAVHEGLHALFWWVTAPISWRAISFGFKWEYLTPYCHCSQPMKVWQFMAGALAPLIVMGIVPVIWAFIKGNTLLMFFGMFYIWTAAGDILAVWMLSRFSAGQLVLDHEDEVGFIIEDKINKM